MSMGVLGPMTFECDADKVRVWRDLKRSAASRWHEHEVYKGKPKSEFTGPGLVELTMQVRFDIERGVVPRDELRQMRKQMDTGAVMQFTVGGDLVGDFTLRDMREDLTHFGRNGVLTVAVATITIREYV